MRLEPPRDRRLLREELAGAPASPYRHDRQFHLESVICAGVTGQCGAQTQPEQVQSEMPIWTFLSEVPAARGPIFDDSAETEQSDWLKEGPSFLIGAGSRASGREGFVPLGEFSKKRDSVRSKNRIAAREAPG